MSLCRFSTDWFQCDLYVYEADEGWAVHVAGNRLASELPHKPTFALLMEDVDEYTRQHNANSAAHELMEHVNIGGLFDSQSFYALDAAELVEKLVELRAAGYRFPDYVIDEAREELAASLLPQGVPGGNPEQGRTK